MAVTPEQRRQYRANYEAKHGKPTREQRRAYHLAWQARNSDYDRAPARRRHKLRVQYGITPEQYEAMVVDQGGRCAICGGTSPGGGQKNWPIDHDHRTGRIRGLLCQTCNMGLGMFGDAAEVIEKAAAYLRKWDVVSRLAP